jgi:t-SNARE complex subunit (syntaxin)
MIGEQSLADLKNNSERSRAELAATVHQLRHKADDTVNEIKEKVSIPHIKREIKNYVSESRNNFIQSMKDKARRTRCRRLRLALACPIRCWG